MKLAPFSKRLKVGILLMSIALSIVIGRSLQLQAIEAKAYAASAAEKITSSRVIVPSRGQISDRNGVVLASTDPAVKIIADPKMISTNGYSEKTMTDKQREKAGRAADEIAAILSKHLGGNTADYLKILTAKTSDGSYYQYQVVRRKVPAAVYSKLSAELKDNGWNGIHSENDPIRNYPEGTLAANILGFTNAENEGAGGLEYYLDASLSGVAGKESYESSIYGKIPLGDNVLNPAVDGANYLLTIDSELQYFSEMLTKSAVEDSQAKSGITIVMDVENGEVLALANYPTFNPNNIAKAKNADLGNRAVTNAYEPGSVHKVITMALLADQGIVNADTKVVVPSRISSGAGYIADAYSHGTEYMTARGVLVNSSNIGMVELIRQSNKEAISNGLKKFGLGAKTGIQLPGEATGMVPGASMPSYTFDQISFGQGISVTAIQEAAAVAAIANGGVYNQPTIIKSAAESNGKPIQLKRAEPRQVISKQAADEVLDMMEAVIATPKYANTRKIEGYRMAGKSGTAERINEATGKYQGYVASFIAVAPVDDPKILVYTVLDRPVKGHQGSAVALPVVKDVMKLALPRYGIVPDAVEQKYSKPISFNP